MNNLLESKTAIITGSNRGIGKKILEETLINWELEFEEKKSISSEDSFLLNIKKIKKKNNI